MSKSHQIDIRVYYEDTDAGGIVYHPSYLKFAERGRTELLRDIGFNHVDLLKEKGVAFAVINMEIKFKGPARLDDLLTVHTRVTDIKGASMGMTQEIRCNDVSLVDIDLRVACLDRDGKAARLPSELREILSS
jgi:acyl-CoA thioester hydrolase